MSSVLETPLPISYILKPISEQQQIVEYLDEQTQLIDKTYPLKKRE
jgi:restriction endonuclease S subunit